jgi:choline-sulfatase
MPMHKGERSKPVNVIFILTDDQGIWAAGCYGNPEIRTPNIDRLAATGVRFDNFFCTSPVCSPSRATLLTGRIPSRHGVHDWIRDGNVPPDAEVYLEGQTTTTDVLAEHGYVCGISGKWHLGASQLAQHHFSHWYVHQQGGGPYNDAPMVRDGELVDEPGYVTNAITDDALAFLDARAGGPFYLSVHYTAPHSPWTGHPQDIVDSYDDCPFESCPQEPRHPWAMGFVDEHLGNRESLKGYFAAVTAMDADVGRIVDRVEELGLREDTLIVFTSDNGYSCGHHGFWGKGNGRLPGRSFLPVLTGESDTGRDLVVVYAEYGPTRMVRTREWKYVHRYPYGPNELYDLANDPDERRNLVEEPEQIARIREMRHHLAEWFAQYVDPVMDGATLPVTGYGQHARIGPQSRGENSFCHSRAGDWGGGTFPVETSRE